MMIKKFLLSFVIVFQLAGLVLAQTSQDVFPNPESHFGFKPGADRELINYQPMIDYLQILADKSPRIAMTEIGVSPFGKSMYAVFLSSEENIENLDQLKKINQDLALNVEMTGQEVNQAIQNGKVFVLATLSMHAGEVAPAQSASLVAYEVATTSDTQLLAWLDDVVYMMIPSHNPDGMDLVVDHYKEYKGTKYEGSSLPVVYHKYVGHDNNRDFVTLTQSDNKAIARIYNKTWFPQVLVEKHQMGSTGPRYFVPPMHDPISENVDEQLWNWTWIFGSNMSKDMSNQNLAGVSQHYMFDDYWPGSTETAIWKNVIGMLTEAASVQTATPIYVEKNELRVGGKGLGEYKKSINMPLPWEGGWWRLLDIVEYELATTWSIIKTAAYHKAEILKFRNDICKKETKKGLSEPPYYYVFPSKQTDPGEMIDFLNLMDEHGVEVFRMTGNLSQMNSRMFRQGDYIIPLSQPFRPFIKEVLEKQYFPERHYTPDGLMIRPYDITSWSLPLHRGLECIEYNDPFESLRDNWEKVDFPLENGFSIPDEAISCGLPAKWNESYRVLFAALEKGIKVSRVKKLPEVWRVNYALGEVNVRKGDFIIDLKGKAGEEMKEIIEGMNTKPAFFNEEKDFETTELSLPKIGLVETVFHDMDAGWTRYVLDSYHVPFTVLKPDEVKEKKLEEFDVVIIPDSDKNLLLEAKYKSTAGVYSVPSYDPKFLKGMGKKGLSDLLSFIDEGGIVLSWGKSTELFMGQQTITISKEKKEEFQFPVRNIGKELASKGVSMPGSLLTIELTNEHPLCYGMGKTVNVFSRGTPVFATSIPKFDMDRRVLGSFPERDILASGFAENEEKLAGKAAMVWIQKNKGQLVLFGFNPQFRASTTSNYKLIFNGILLGQ